MGTKNGASAVRHFLCKAEEVEEDEPVQVTLPDDRVVAVYCLPDGYYATDDLCSHGEASLAEGELEDYEILCPFHLGAFDVRTGEATRAPCVNAIKAYSVSIEGDALYLEE